MIDRDFILVIFHQDCETALSLFIDFHKRQDNGEFLDISERRRITDEEAAAIIKQICHVTHCTDLQKLKKKDERDKFLSALKDRGLSIRQIARLTGISRGVIIKA